MQTFLPSSDFYESAKVLDNRRLGKQRIECLQILQTLTKGPTIKVCRGCGIHCSCEESDFVDRKTPWYNHPAVKMWRGFELSLVQYGLIVCEEWIIRGFNDTCRGKILKVLSLDKLKEPIIHPKWLGDERFYASHRSNLLRKNREHYGQFNWKEPDNLPYFWPTKEGY